jgi:hypothetical protein
VKAVNNLSGFGSWDFLVCRNLGRLLPSLGGLPGVEGHSPAEAVAVERSAGTLFGEGTP